MRQVIMLFSSLFCLTFSNKQREKNKIDKMKTKGKMPILRLGKRDGQNDKFKNRFYEATSKTG